MMKHMKFITIIYLSFVILSSLACSQTTVNNKNSGNNTSSTGLSKHKSSGYKVTFIELGSVRCIPCKKMQPVMKSIEEKYGDQVKVVFHDVWTPEGEPFGDKFAIQSIPTQVFLDENGKEFFRHVGYFPEEDLVKVLKEKGVH